ncbi:hypothetical protein FRC07_008271, partial [Ceratobasidium sp. 392]
AVEFGLERMGSELVVRIGGGHGSYGDSDEGTGSVQNPPQLMLFNMLRQQLSNGTSREV